MQHKNNQNSYEFEGKYKILATYKYESNKKK